MADETSVLADQSCPPPSRGRFGLIVLVFGLSAGPSAWGLRLLVNYGLASQACFLRQAGRSEGDGNGRLWLLLLALDVIAMAVSAMAALVSYRMWRGASQCVPGRIADFNAISAERTRFLALWGMTIGAGFFVFVLFDVVFLLGLPLCG